jgi:coenzyme F420-0:L-glutamate ligase / coenzyme F420-1:gamma-L-glutamate ligase
MSARLSIFGVNSMPDVSDGDKLASLLIEALEKQGDTLEDGDIVVVTQKVVSLAEGRVVRLADVTPSQFSEQLAATIGKDPREVEVVLQESNRIVRSTKNVLLTETRHGFICANSGVDKSNIGEGLAVLLPVDPDKSAAQIRFALQDYYGVSLAVVISDTFGRPWRMGQTNVAIGLSGISAFADYRGQDDPHGNTMRVTQISIADELACAAELVMGKFDRVPVAVVRGYPHMESNDKATVLVRPKEMDLFI